MLSDALNTTACTSGCARVLTHAMNMHPYLLTPNGSRSNRHVRACVCACEHVQVRTVNGARAHCIRDAPQVVAESVSDLQLKLSTWTMRWPTTLVVATRCRPGNARYDPHAPTAPRVYLAYFRLVIWYLPSGQRSLAHPEDFRKLPRRLHTHPGPHLRRALPTVTWGIAVQRTTTSLGMAGDDRLGASRCARSLGRTHTHTHQFRRPLNDERQCRIHCS